MEIYAINLIRLFIAAISIGIGFASNKGNGLKIPVKLQPQIAGYSLANIGGNNV
jgi:hypothetical protein